MILKLDKNMTTLKGEPTNEKLSDVLANMLAMASSANPAKMITWAVNLTNNGEIEVQKKDIPILMDLIERDKNFINLAKAQLIDQIEKLEF